jgi:cobalamin biosynthesis protein CbiG
MHREPLAEDQRRTEPLALCIGVGCTRGVPPADFGVAAASILAAAGLPPAAVRLVATAGRKQDEPALRQWAESLGAGFVSVDDAILAAQPVTTRSDRVHRAVGLTSVAEAAALAAAGATELLLTRRTAALPGGHHLTLAAAVMRRT